MKKRIFIAISLTPELVEIIRRKVENLRPELPSARFLESPNWHLTISFLGYQDNDSVGKIIQSLGETVKEFEAPEIIFEELDYGPPTPSPPAACLPAGRERAGLRRAGPPGQARMLWLKTDSATSKILTAIKSSLEEHLQANGVIFRRENRPFNGHLTLARFRPGQFPLPLVREKFMLDFRAQSLDLMESKLRREGAQYSVLQKFIFPKH